MKDLYKIITGIVKFKVNGLTVTVEPFSLYHRYMAEILGEEEYDKAFELGHYTEEEMLQNMMEDGSWDEEREKSLKEIPQNIEQMKVDYYNNFYSEKTKEYIKKNIDYQKDRLYKLYNYKNSFFSGTCEFIRSQFKICYLVENSVRFDDNTFSLNNFSIFTLVNKYISNIPNDEEIREIAKSDIWRSIWGAGKTISNVFGKPAIELTEQQLSLINWTRTYDSVYESTETPSDDIINDNNALDGWFIIQRRKREKERKQKDIDNKLGKNAGAGEIFIPAQTEQEMKAIYEMNDVEGKVKLKSLENDLKRVKSVNVENTMSAKKEVSMLRNIAMSEIMKGRR